MWTFFDLIVYALYRVNTACNRALFTVISSFMAFVPMSIGS